MKEKLEETAGVSAGTALRSKWMPELTEWIKTLVIAFVTSPSKCHKPKVAAVTIGLIAITINAVTHALNRCFFIFLPLNSHHAVYIIH